MPTQLGAKLAELVVLAGLPAAGPPAGVPVQPGATDLGSAAGLRWLKCLGTRMRASTSAGVVKSPSDQRARLAEASAAGSSTTARPGRHRRRPALALPLPGDGPLPVGDGDPQGEVLVEVAVVALRLDAVRLDGLGVALHLPGRPTTDRSAWNCANDDSSSARADSAPTLPTRFTAMLYDGRKLDRSGYVRVEARPATCRGSVSGDHTTTACPSTSMPRRPARPVSWVYSPGVRSTCASPLYLTRRSSTTQRAGMLMPRARVSVAKTALTSPRTNNSSTTSLNAGSIPAWCAASPRSSPSSHSQ